MVTAGMLLMSVGLSGCDKKDEPIVGKWTPMKWETDVTMDGHMVTVPQQGGTYQFTCTNYEGFWLAGLEEQTFDPDNKREVTIYSYPDDTYRTIKGVWADATVQGNVMTVTVSANDTGKSRTAVVMPTGGDIFDHFRFSQP